MIHFEAMHRPTPLNERRFGALAAELSAWRMILSGLGLIGIDPSRYDGAAYGNVSGRIGPFPGRRGQRKFLVSASQTGALRCLTLKDYAVVDSYDFQSNQVHSMGQSMPSSESMTHGAIYDLAPYLRFVFHVHSPLIWRRAKGLKLPMSSRDIGYGTPDMAREVARLSQKTTILDRQVFGMAGHEDGIIAFGRTAAEAGTALMKTHAAAQIMQFEEDGTVCY